MKYIPEVCHTIYLTFLRYDFLVVKTISRIFLCHKCLAT